MKWFTCFVHVYGHVTPVQYFHTRAETAADAELNAVRWFEEPHQKIPPDVAFILEGKLEPEVFESRLR